MPVKRITPLVGLRYHERPVLNHLDPSCHPPSLPRLRRSAAAPGRRCGHRRVSNRLT